MKEDVIGRTYGDFTVIGLHSYTRTSGTKYRCRCKLCGGTKVLKQSELFHDPRHAERACYAKHYVPSKHTSVIDPCGGRKGCKHWRKLDTAAPDCCCHYLLDHDERRPRDENGNCLGYCKGEYVRSAVPLAWCES